MDVSSFPAEYKIFIFKLINMKIKLRASFISQVQSWSNFSNDLELLTFDLIESQLTVFDL